MVVLSAGFFFVSKEIEKISVKKKIRFAWIWSDGYGIFFLCIKTEKMATCIHQVTAFSSCDCFVWFYRVFHSGLFFSDEPCPESGWKTRAQSLQNSMLRYWQTTLCFHYRKDMSYQSSPSCRMVPSTSLCMWIQVVPVWHFQWRPSDKSTL